MEMTDKAPPEALSIQGTASMMFHNGVAGGRNHGGGPGDVTRNVSFCDGAGSGGEPEGAEETEPVRHHRIGGQR